MPASAATAVDRSPQEGSVVPAGSAATSAVGRRSGAVARPSPRTSLVSTAATVGVPCAPSTAERYHPDAQLPAPPARLWKCRSVASPRDLQQHREPHPSACPPTLESPAASPHSHSTTTASKELPTSRERLWSPPALPPQARTTGLTARGGSRHHLVTPLGWLVSTRSRVAGFGRSVAPSRMKSCSSSSLPSGIAAMCTTADQSPAARCSCLGGRPALGWDHISPAACGARRWSWCRASPCPG